MNVMNEIAKYNSQVSWYAPLTRINLGIHGMRSLVLQGAFLTITTLALAIILAQNGSFAAAFANQKVAMAIVLTSIGLQCLKFGINSYTYNQKKNIRESVQAEIDILLPNQAIAKDSKHLYSTTLPGTLKSIVTEYVGFQDLTTVCYLMNEFGSALSNYQNYWKQRTGADSWEDIRTVFTDLGIALKENRDKSEDECGLIERLSSFDSLDNIECFEEFFCGWDYLSRTCESRIDRHLPILTRYFTFDPQRILPGNYSIQGTFQYTLDLMESGNEDLMWLALKRGMFHSNATSVVYRTTEKTVLFVHRNFQVSKYKGYVGMTTTCLHGWAEHLEESINKHGRDIISRWTAIDCALFGAFLQKKILAKQKIPSDLFIFDALYNYCLKIDEVSRGNYKKTIQLLVQNGVDIHTRNYLEMTPLRFARQHPELAEYIPILEGRQVD